MIRARRWVWLATAWCGLATPGVATAEDRDYCPTRPGLGTAPCTIAPGHVSVETALVDWSREVDTASRTDQVLIGDTLVRVGMADAAELQIGWTPYGTVRVRNRQSGALDRSGAAGDLTLAAKVNLRHPDGSGFSVAVQPFVSVPVGRAPIGAGDWGGGLVVPVSYDLGHGLNAQSTAEVDAAPDSDGAGRHLAYSETIGLGIELTKRLTGTIEFQAARDDDPGAATTRDYAALALAWMPTDDLQLDVGGVAGLNGAATDAELYIGVSCRF